MTFQVVIYGVLALIAFAGVVIGLAVLVGLAEGGKR